MPASNGIICESLSSRLKPHASNSLRKYLALACNFSRRQFSAVIMSSDAKNPAKSCGVSAELKIIGNAVYQPSTYDPYVYNGDTLAVFFVLARFI